MYDICIIGGGINGVSTALQCSERGFKTILFEQKHLANGASSKTSKLAHGGLRYLENLEIGLVKESLQERNRLMTDYPDMVKYNLLLYHLALVQSRLHLRCHPK